MVGTTFTHEKPHRDLNYYWVSACDAQGCSFVYGERSAQFAGDRPASPTNLRFDRQGANAVVNWEPSVGATHYKIYFNGYGRMRCSVSRIGLTLGCEVLDDNVTQSSYVHADPSDEENLYWVVACNRGGCSEIDSENPAEPV